MKTRFCSNYHCCFGLLACCASLAAFSTGTLHAAAGVTINDVASVAQIGAFVRPIVWTGDQLPTGDDTSALATAIAVWHTQGEEAGAEALEIFIGTYTNSAWLPSLRSQLGKYYRERGRYTLALQHWEASWAATRDATDGPAKEVADFTLAFYTRLLASLGRIETLDEIFSATTGRTLDSGPLQQMYLRTREGWAQMHRNPGHSYRCGAFALNEVAKTIEPPSIGLPLPRASRWQSSWRCKIRSTWDWSRP